jgi:hypothetical protein
MSRPQELDFPGSVLQHTDPPGTGRQMMEATIVRSGDGAGATVMGDVWETALEAVCGDSAPAWAGTAASASNRAEDVAKTAMRRIILQYLMDTTYQQLSTLSKAKGLIYMTPFYHSSLTEAKFGLARWHFETFEDVELKSPAISFRPIYHFVNPVVDADFSESIKPGLNAGDYWCPSRPPGVHIKLTSTVNYPKPPHPTNSPKRRKTRCQSGFSCNSSTISQTIETFWRRDRDSSWRL